MLNPIEIPLPLALAVIAALVYAATLIRTSATLRPAPAAPAAARHRLDSASTAQTQARERFIAERNARLAAQTISAPVLPPGEQITVTYSWASDDTREWAIAA